MSEPKLPLPNNSRLSGELIPHFLRIAVDATRTSEAQFRDFAATVYDDEELQRLFVRLSEQARAQRRRLETRFKELSGASDQLAADSNGMLDLASEPASSAGVPEERTLQNLIAGYAVASGELAAYQVLAAVAEAAGDSITQRLASEMAADGRASADQIWHFLPSRSKIAFNMLTISEVDPSVETKVADNRLFES